MEIDATTANTALPQAAPNGAAGLDADDFLQLLVTQLANQDPLAPTSNEEILRQLSAIRDIQLSTTLTDSLQTLTGNQRYGAAASLIGKQVTGNAGDDASGRLPVSGSVVAIHFESGGNVRLELDNGESFPLERLESVTDPSESADALLGKLVRGRDPQDSAEFIEGVVTAVRRNHPADDALLELDTGETLKFGDLVAA